MKLTKAQHRFLAACLEFERGPTPRGLHYSVTDMRTMPAVMERGLIAYCPLEKLHRRPKDTP